MVKILGLCVTMVALVVIAESRPYQYSSYNEECNNYECSEEAYKQFRDDAQHFLNQIAGIINNILETGERYIDEMREQRLGRPNTVIIGPGEHNNNKVIVNGGNYSV